MKIRKPKQRNESIKKNPIEILELKKTVTEIKCSVDWLSCRKEGIEDKISELNDGKTEINQFEQQGKKDNKNEQPPRPVGL